MSSGGRRIDWVDYAKGFCIVMVVMMHSTLGVEKATGTTNWMHVLVLFAQPFRMPDFFMISGLFLAKAIDRDWRTFLDRRLVHFAYFYVLWLLIQFAFKAPGLYAEFGAAETVRLFALAFVDPFGTMWFIYLLPIFFILVKATRGVPWWLVWLAGALLESARISTGWTVVDEFAARFVYFFSGYLFAAPILRFAAAVGERRAAGVAYLVVWGAVNGLAVWSGIAALPGASLVLGFAGAVAVMTGASLLSRHDWMAPLRYCGEHSLVIYLAFFLPMAATRAMLLRSGVVADLGLVSLLVTAAGVIVPLLLYWAVRNTAFRFLFERPAWAWLKPAPARLAPAE
jgi:uncharacterized membrane protein YcfT